MLSQKEVFDEIAGSWYGFRHHTRFRHELDELAQRWRSGRLLNLGCGHGADFVPFKNSFKLYGVDFSPKMIKLAQQYAQKHGFTTELDIADIRRLPYKDSSFDYAIAIAVYHHIKGREETLKALSELKRILKKDGEAFLTVWNRRQVRFWLSRHDVMVPWHKKGKTLYRYYHLFSHREIENLVREAGFTIIRSSAEHSYRFPIKIFARNVCLLIKR